MKSPFYISADGMSGRHLASFGVFNISPIIHKIQMQYILRLSDMIAWLSHMDKRTLWDPKSTFPKSSWFRLLTAMTNFVYNNCNFVTGLNSPLFLASINFMTSERVCTFPYYCSFLLNRILVALIYAVWTLRVQRHDNWQPHAKRDYQNSRDEVFDDGSCISLMALIWFPPREIQVMTSRNRAFSGSGCWLWKKGKISWGWTSRWANLVDALYTSIWLTPEK